MSESLDTTATPGQEMAEFTQRNIMGTLFETTARYQHLEPVGMGVSGLVCSARDQICHQAVAIKKLCQPFRTKSIAKHMYREVKLLKQLQHDNIIRLNDIFISPSEEIYLVTSLMVTDLHALIKTKIIDNQISQYFLYQIMRGLKYVHSAGVIHRDLKPSNILINENCDLKICDFGSARVQDMQMTGYVSTRYYRAPEIMLTWKLYDEKIDIWSAGCIFAEMMMGRPLFLGKNHIDQFCVITELLGNQPDKVITKISSENTLNLIRSLPKRSRKAFVTIIPAACRKAINLLDKILQFDPEKRCSATDALESEYLSPYHDPEDEPVAPKFAEWSFLEADISADVWKSMMYAEVLDYHEQSGRTVPAG